MNNLLSIILSFVLVSSSAIATGSDFDKVCGYFENLQVEISKRNLSKTERKNFITNLVEKELKADSAARQAWEVVFFAVPEVRYELYKTSAEDASKYKWHCKAMEKLIPTTGK